MTRRLARSAIIAVIATALSATVALGWDDPALDAECAPDKLTYAWTITLPTEKNQVIQLSFDGFETKWTVDFESAGSHSFFTPRDGDELEARYQSDHRAKTEAEANKELCEQPSPSTSASASPTPSTEPTPTPEATPEASPTPEPTPSHSPPVPTLPEEPTPTASVPDTATATTAPATDSGAVGLALIAAALGVILILLGLIGVARQR